MEYMSNTQKAQKRGARAPHRSNHYSVRLQCSKECQKSWSPFDTCHVKKRRAEKPNSLICGFKVAHALARTLMLLMQFSFSRLELVFNEDTEPGHKMAVVQDSRVLEYIHLANARPGT